MISVLDKIMSHDAQICSFNNIDVQQTDDDHTPPAEILKCAALLSHND